MIQNCPRASKNSSPHLAEKLLLQRRIQAHLWPEGKAWPFVRRGIPFSISTSCQNHISLRRVPHSALLSRVGGFVEAQPNNLPRAFGVRRLCRRLSAVGATTQTHARGAPQFFVCATLAFGRHPERSVAPVSTAESLQNLAEGREFKPALSSAVVAV
jgi:hypothetical protein